MRIPGLLTFFVLVVAPYDTPPAQQTNGPASQRTAPAIRESVYRRLSSAQQCVEGEDLACADQLINEVFAMEDLNSYERAQAWNFQAYVDFSRDDHAAAISAYENMLLEPDVPAGLEQTTKYSLAQLYASEERFAEALEALDDWWKDADVRSPEPYVLRAQIRYQLDDHRASLAAIEDAIELAAATGRSPDESWYQIRFADLWSQGEHERAADVMETMIRLWPKRTYFIQLSGIYGQLDNPKRQLDLFEAAYGSGWLESGAQIVTLAGLQLKADRPEDALEALEQNLARGPLSEGVAVRTLVTRAAQWVDGEPIDAMELEMLLDEALTEAREADRQAADAADGAGDASRGSRGAGFRRL